MTHARFIDPNRFYRKGGIDRAKLRAAKDRGDCEALFVQAGIGMNMAATLEEQVQVASDLGMPHMTWHIPDYRYSIIGQAQAYLSWPGVAGHVLCGDIENVSTFVRHLNAAELKVYYSVLSAQGETWLYTRVNILEAIFPNGIPALYDDTKYWIAQYIYENWLLRQQYQRYDGFVAKYDGKLPPAVMGSKLFASQNKRDQVMGWQFSEKGDAQYYLASAKTEDPVNKNGITVCDLNVCPRWTPADLTAALGGGIVEPPPGQEIIMQKYQIVAGKGLNLRVWHDDIATPIKKLPLGTFVFGTGATFIENPGEAWAEVTHEGSKGWIACMFYGGQVLAKTI
jgi:hypothetical protein